MKKNRELDNFKDNSISIESDNKLKIGDWVLATGSLEDNASFDFFNEDKQQLAYNLWYISDFGSNYVELTSPLQSHLAKEHALYSNIARVRLEHMYLLEKVDALSLIDKKLNIAQEEFKELTEQISLISYGFSHSEEQTETSMMPTVITVNPIEAKQELISVKDNHLPKLHTEIKKKAQEISNLALLKIAPYKLQSKEINNIENAIDNYIFNIDLYAGLSEKIQYIASGQRADIEEKIHIFQEKLYMDEESLIGVMASGFRFDDIEQFHEWLSMPVNRDRILPFQKCIVAFQVRRKNYNTLDDITLRYMRDSPYQKILRNKEDGFTYLYFRNGENIGRIINEHELGKLLFDNEMFEYLGEQKYIYKATKFFSDSEDSIFFDRYNKLKNLIGFRHWESLEEEEKALYEPVDKNNIYYDDIMQAIKSKMTEFNRFGLILMGLLDRSDIFAPHSKFSMFDESFKDHIKLINDYTNVIPNKITPPDIEEYIKKGRSEIKAGTLVFGAYPHWLMREAKRENSKNSRTYYGSTEVYHTYFVPDYDKNGCGYYSKVDRINNKGEAVISWMRPRAVKHYWNIDETKLVKDEICVPLDQLCNIDAYNVGDYAMFFNDKRTRKDYRKWAGFMLLAEELKREK